MHSPTCVSLWVLQAFTAPLAWVSPWALLGSQSHSHKHCGLLWALQVFMDPLAWAVVAPFVWVLVAPLAWAIGEHAFNPPPQKKHPFFPPTPTLGRQPWKVRELCINSVIITCNHLFYFLCQAKQLLSLIPQFSDTYFWLPHQSNIFKHVYLFYITKDKIQNKEEEKKKKTV